MRKKEETQSQPGKLRRLYDGYVVIQITGLAPERIVNMAVAQGIPMWDISREGSGKIQASMPAAQFYMLRKWMRRCRCRVKIIKKHGMPFVTFKLRYRRMFVAGLATTLALLYLASGFLWRIDIEGGSGEAQQSVMEWLEDTAGVRTGIWKEKLDTQQLQRSILLAHPSLSWVGLRLHGIHLYVEIVEGTQPPEIIDETRHADVVASQDAVIDELRVYSGRAQVEIGEVVRRGQVLISGEGGHARGEVMGRIWMEGKAVAPMWAENRLETGRSSLDRAFLLGPWRITIEEKGDPFQHSRQEIRHKPFFDGLYFPIMLERVEYRELEIEILPVDEDTAKRRARNLAEEVLNAKWPESLPLVDKQVYYSIMEGEKWVEAKVVAQGRTTISETLFR